MIRGKKHALKRLDPRRNVELPVRLHNRFDVEVIDATTGKIRQKAQAENVICDALWTRLLTPAAYFNYIHYGTGSGTPAATDTSLYMFLGYGTPSTDNDIYAAGATWASVRRKIQLSETTAVGAMLTEVGIAYDTGSATLMTHAMLRDMNGNQISIEKSDTDVINIYATVFVHWSESIDSGSIMVTDFYTYHRYLIKALCGIISFGTSGANNVACCRNGYDGTRGSGGYGPSNDLPIRATTTKTYDVASKTITFTAARLDVSTGNVGGINEISIGNIQASESGGSYLYEFSMKLRVGGTWYTSTAITGEAIGTGDGTTTDFATDFPFASDATIYVDGVEQTTGMSIDEGIPQTPSDMGAWFEFLPLYSSRPTSEGSSSPYASNYTVHSASGVAAFYNPYFSQGLTGFYYYPTSAASKVECSDDLNTWVTVASGASAATVSIPSGYACYKYWRLTACTTKLWTSAGITVNNIHFDTAPASGAVVTGDYTTKSIAKDANHVFDLTVTLTLAEKTE